MRWGGEDLKVHSNLASLVWPFSFPRAYTKELLAKDIISLSRIYLPKQSEATDSFTKGLQLLQRVRNSSLALGRSSQQMSYYITILTKTQPFYNDNSTQSLRRNLGKQKIEGKVMISFDQGCAQCLGVGVVMCIAMPQSPAGLPHTKAGQGFPPPQDSLLLNIAAQHWAAASSTVYTTHFCVLTLSVGKDWLSL